MSSGNYSPFRPKNWFDHNRNAVIDAFNNQAQSKRAQAKLKKLKKEIDLIEKEKTHRWNKFRDSCIRNESVGEE